MTPAILIINSGSSSLKFGLYTQQQGTETLLLDGLADSIGQPSSSLELKDAEGKILRSDNSPIPSAEAALDRAAQWLEDLAPTPVAIGHRVVHGGPNLLTHQRITPQVLQQLEAAVHFAPLHIPPALALIHKCQATYPSLPQFACFDTAFHNTIPELSARFPLPRELYVEGVRRYGFHGLSYESIVHSLGTQLAPRTVIAHLGSGASLAALQNGKSIDTTMGLTPTGGIPMATRTGDLDPGVLLYLLRVKNMDADSLEDLLNRQSGLKAISGTTGDMRQLTHAAATGDRNAKLAIDIFTTSIRQTTASYTALLGGLDILVFSGGIGEHSAEVRDAVTTGLNFLPPFKTLTIPSQEDLQIARHTRTLLNS